MPGFDFSRISPYIEQYFDSDLIDIGRAYTITLPDGSESEVSPDTPLYIGVPCHVSFKEVDNPNAATVGTDPIIIPLTIECKITTDLQNKDKVTAHVRSASGEILETYVGTIGMPVTEQSRKKAIMMASQVL